jgi:hypothetical protein
MQSVGSNSLNRREMLRLGAAGAGGLLLSSAASSQTLVPSILSQPMAPVEPVTRVAAAPVTPLGVDPTLFQKARAALDSHRIAPRDSIGIVDFTLASRDPRFHLVDLAGGTVESFRVAHGRGSDPDHSGFVERFSNQPGSEATSNGTYTTGEYYHGKYGLSMKVDGLDWSNSNAAARAIVIHNAWYAEPEMIDIHGKLGRSEGCFALSRADQWKVMSKLAGGRMIFAEKLIA